MNGGPIPPKHVTEPKDPTVVRLACLENALMTVQQADIAYNEKGVIALAKEYEKYVWGGFAPIEQAPTLMNTLGGNANAVKIMLIDLYTNALDPEKKKQISDALEIWERFMADISFAIEPPEEAPVVQPSQPKIMDDDSVD